MNNLAQVIEEQAWMIRNQAHTIERLAMLLLQYVEEDEIDELVRLLVDEEDCNAVHD